MRVAAMPARPVNGSRISAALPTRVELQPAVEGLVTQVGEEVVVAVGTRATDVRKSDLRRLLLPHAELHERPRDVVSGHGGSQLRSRRCSARSLARRSASCRRPGTSCGSDSKMTRCPASRGRESRVSVSTDMRRVAGTTITR